MIKVYTHIYGLSTLRLILPCYFFNAFWSPALAAESSVFVSPFCSIILWMASSTFLEAASQFSPGGGPENTTSLLEFIEMIENYTGIKMKYKFDDWRPSDQKVYISDISKIAKRLSWQPRIGASYGIKLLVQWVKDNIGAF